MSDPVVDPVTGEVREGLACEHCDRMSRELQQAHQDLAVAETTMRKMRRTEQALRAQLSDRHKNGPDSEKVMEVLEHWKAKCKPRARIGTDGKRADYVRKQLKHYSVDQLKQAVDGLAKLPAVGEKGGRVPAGTPNSTVYNDVEHFCSDEIRVERCMGHANDDEQPKPSAPAPGPRKPYDGPTGVQAVLERLDGVKEAKPGQQWEARCPAHEDRHASLSVGQGEKGAVVTCHAGCTSEEIVHSLGLEMGRLFDPEPASIATPIQRSTVQEPQMTEQQLRQYQLRLENHPALLERLRDLRGWRPDAIFEIGLGFDGERIVMPVRDRDLKLLGAVRYLPGKRAEGVRKLLAPKGMPRDLFPPPESLPDDATIWLLEGEPDSVSALGIGLRGTAVPGVNGWKGDWSSRFAGRNVVVCFDCDEPGRRAADKVAALLAPVAASLRVFDLDPQRDNGYDLTEAVMDGATAGMLTAMAEAEGRDQTVLRMAS